MRKNRDGFTFIELLVVLSIIGILSVVGIAAFVDYSRKQALSTATLELSTVLQVAKSRSQSQVKPESGWPCSVNSLDGYRVTITSDKDYKLSAVCAGNDQTLDTKSLPTNITFSQDKPTFFFRSVSGGADEGTITIYGYGQAKCIGVTSAAVISLETCAIPTSVPPTPTPTPTPTLTPTLTLCQGYRDEDGDTYGAGKGTGYQNGTLVSVTCAQGGGLPAGYASRAGDCYDKNANAKPGNNTWQTTTRGTSVLGKDSENNTWSSYDYNCDGLETKETSSVRLYRTYSPCDDDSGNQNYACEWSDETNWACGASGYTGCSDSRGECNGAHWSSPSRSGYITNRCY